MSRTIKKTDDNDTAKTVAAVVLTVCLVLTVVLVAHHIGYRDGAIGVATGKVVVSRDVDSGKWRVKEVEDGE